MLSIPRTISIADNASSAIASPIKLVDGSSTRSPVAKIAFGKSNVIKLLKSLFPSVPSMLAMLASMIPGRRIIGIKPTTDCVLFLVH